MIPYNPMCACAWGFCAFGCRDHDRMHSIDSLLQTGFAFFVHPVHLMGHFHWGAYLVVEVCTLRCLREVACGGKFVYDC